jgi:hypothetical protein
MVLYEDNRVCRGCGRMGVTRHTCPFCPYNYCKKDGHIANNCTMAQESKKSHRPVGNFADGIQLPVALYLIPSQLSRGKTNNDFRFATMQEVAQWLQVLLTEVDRVVPAQTHWADISHNAHQPLIPASRLRERWSPSPSPRTLEKKSMTTPTTLTLYASPLLDAKVSYPERLKSFRSN